MDMEKGTRKKASGDTGDSALPPAKKMGTGGKPPMPRGDSTALPAKGTDSHNAKNPLRRIRVPKGFAYALCGVLLLFSVGGIAAALVLGLEGLKLLSPVLLGPGLTILGLGLLYDFTIRPLASFHEELHAMIARTYAMIGGLFSLLGILFWYLG